jgi:tRNA A-37 threonylcarbamoyl transferase component Bud32
VIQREQDGVRWELQPEFAPLLDELLSSPGETVKQSPAKHVTRHRAGGKSFYIKRYFHHAVPLRPLKFLFKKTQARREWELAQQLEARHIPIVRHVALGERRVWSGVLESILVTEGFDGLPIKDKPGVDLASVLQFVQGMHDQGVLQVDLHPGNLLVRPQPFEVRLVDLHGIQILTRVSEEQRASNLALLRLYVPIPVSREIVQLSKRKRQELFRQRSARWVRRNRDFDSMRVGQLKWRTRLSFVNEKARRIMAAPDAFLDSGAKLLKNGRSSTVGKGDGFVLKRYNFKKAENLIKDIFRPSRASRAFRTAYHLELLGIPTARPIASADKRMLGLPARSYFLMEEIVGAVDLGTYLRDGGQPDTDLVHQLARFVAKLHNEGFSHRDLKQTNLLLDGDRKIRLIDLDGVKFVWRVPEDRCAADLVRLAEGMQKFPAVTSRCRFLFLLAYGRARGLKRLPRAA